MATAVRVSEELVQEARKFSRVDHRSITGQIEHWAKIGKCVEANPDLTYDLIKEILIGLEELEQGELSEYKFG
ncbi:MAG: ParD-like family protein [Nitrospinae bacterium]|nr:ParD-like family protein [Nitrospinota bacterium]